MKNTKKQIVTTIVACTFLLLGAIAGILAIVYGKQVLAIDKYSYRVGILGFNEKIEFGTDYYTEMYQTNAMAANSAYATFTAVKTGLGYFLIVFGILAIALCGYKIFNVIYKNINPANTTANNSTIVKEIQGHKISTNEIEDNKMREELLTLNQLYEAGAITEEEFEAQKRLILGF